MNICKKSCLLVIIAAVIFSAGLARTDLAWADCSFDAINNNDNFLADEPIDLSVWIRNVNSQHTNSNLSLQLSLYEYNHQVPLWSYSVLFPANADSGFTSSTGIHLQYFTNDPSLSFPSFLADGNYRIRAVLVRTFDGLEIETADWVYFSVSSSNLVINGLNGAVFAPGPVKFSVNANIRPTSNITNSSVLSYQGRLWRNGLPYVDSGLSCSDSTTTITWTSNEFTWNWRQPFPQPIDPTMSILDKADFSTGNLPAGDYTLEIELLNSGSHLAGTTTWFSVQRMPRLLSRAPVGDQIIPNNINNQTIVSQNTAINGLTRQYITLGFEYDDDLILSSSALPLIQWSSSVSSGSGSIIDQWLLDQIFSDIFNEDLVNKYIFTRSNDIYYLKIPITSPVSNSSYTVNIAGGIVELVGGNGNSPIPNDPATPWTFSTMSAPWVYPSYFLGQSGFSNYSFGQDYTDDTNILIYGDNFDNYTQVIFYTGTSSDARNFGIPASRVEFIPAITPTLNDPGNPDHLKAYLPVGSKRLAPGSYNVLVIKAAGYEDDEFRDALSIIPRAALPEPTDGERINQDFDLGEVVSTIATSSDTVKISSGKGYGVRVNLDLDELLGNEVLMRKIQFYDHRLPKELVIASRGAKIILMGIQPVTNVFSEYSLSVGGVSPFQAESIKKLLRGKVLRSEFLEVGLESLRIQNIEINMPFNADSTSRLQVMRYDPNSRKWTQQPADFDAVNQTASFSSPASGIFVICE